MQKKETSSRFLIKDKSVEWDPQSKEPWLLDFEKQPVNDEKWSCLVTSAIQAKHGDEECIQIYKQFVNQGSGNFNKVISKSDIIDSFRKIRNSFSGKINGKTFRVRPVQQGKGETKKQKEERKEEREITEEKPGSPLFNQLQNLMYKYGSYSESEWEIRPELMAILTKYTILKMKKDSIREKKINAVRKRKIRERELKAKFIRDLKPFEVSDDVSEIPDVSEQENDEPIDGPDLYVMLTDFFDVDYYPELIKINVPFVAFLKTGSLDDGEEKRNTDDLTESIEGHKKNAVIEQFWEDLENKSNKSKQVLSFKDMAVINYDPEGLIRDGDLNYVNQKIIYDELVWMQYAVYQIYNIHKKFIRQFFVQKVSVSLEPFDLSKCDVYNKLCDALLTGQPSTPLFILYAMIEQLVVGVHETKSTKYEFKLSSSDYFPQRSEINILRKNISKVSTKEVVTPCTQCRCKADYFTKVCGPILEEGESAEGKTAEESVNKGNSSMKKSAAGKLTKPIRLEERKISIQLLDEILSERKSEKEIKRDKKWKTPVLCFHGDLLTLEAYHCDPRIIDTQNVIERFLKSTDLLKIWGKYPELPPEYKAFYNFHYDRLLRISKEKEDVLKIKIFFTLLMKVAGISKLYFFRGEESNLSEKFSEGWRNKREFSKMNTTALQKSGFLNGFSNFYFKTFVLNSCYNYPKKTTIQIETRKRSDSNFAWMLQEDSGAHLLRSNITYNLHNFLNLGSLPPITPGLNNFDKSNLMLSSILDCFDMSILSDFETLRKNEDFQFLIKNFNYYEKLTPHVMMQRLLEPRDMYNTIHCTHFAPTDSLAILMFNDSDHRGIFYRLVSGSLPTPVSLKDFYAYLLPEMRGWIAQNISDNWLLVSKRMEEEAILEEKRDQKYLEELKQHYCSLSESARKEFLEEKIDFTSQPEVSESELDKLPSKVKLDNSNETTFIGFDFKDLRVETSTKINEFHSKDGTKVHVAVDSWLYDDSKLVTLKIKRSTLWFRYFFPLPNSEEGVIFTLSTPSDIIFVFYREPDDSWEENSPKYKVKISWPTGLLIEVKSASDSSSRYIKQYYLQSYKRGWEIEDEKCRCYLENGEIIIFKETGDIKILTVNGTIHNLYYGERSRCETVTMTGAVWEQRIGKIRRFNRRKISSYKVYIGVDCKTRETYYKRDDGVFCMLWPNGKLVTSYPDGTKITSIPEFDKEIVVDWSDEEKKYFQEIEVKQMEETEHRSRVILRNFGGKYSRKSIEVEEFVCVTCTYLMEHPKYSTVYAERKTSLLEIRMLENISVKTDKEGSYRVEQEDKHLIVTDDSVEFNTQCNICKEISTSVMNFDSDDICQTIDFFHTKFVVYKDGSTQFFENSRESKIQGESDVESQKSNNNLWCQTQHNACVGLEQRCFIIERDLSGIEFIHSENLASNNHDLQDDTYFDINTEDLTHTFSTPLSKIGYENWVMKYEKDDSLPVNLRKQDLKEIDVKENRRKLFEYPFPQYYNIGKSKSTQIRRKIEMPKVNLVRIINCLPLNPNDVINEVNNYVAKYQKRARDICKEYKKYASMRNTSDDERYVKMRLRKIAVTLSQNLSLHPYLCTQVPSTEADIHYFGHYVNAMEEMKSHFHDPSELPDCKQIPQRLPCKTDFPTIQEETASELQTD